MARFYGAIGYVEEVETAIDVIDNRPVERMYKGELIRNNRRLENGLGVNDNVSISNQISIVADPYANNHIHAMRYVKWRGTAWKVSNVDVEPPRLILSLGGVYNGETAK
jgi:hypothetical protein